MQFLKSSLLTGIYVLLPLLLLWLGIREIGELLAALAEPIVDLLPSGYFDNLKWPGIVAATFVATSAIVIGALAKVSFVADLAQKFEASVLYRVPMYQMLKIISSSLVKPERSEVRPAIVKDDAGGGDPCYVMERHDTGLATVLVPWSPASFAGSIKVVPESRLEYLDCTLDEYSRTISYMGIGVGKCLARTVEKKSE